MTHQLLSLGDLLHNLPGVLPLNLAIFANKSGVNKSIWHTSSITFPFSPDKRNIAKVKRSSDYKLPIY